MKKTFKLKDVGDNIPKGPNNIEVAVEVCGGGIFLYPKGYGDHTSQDGKGSPVLLELYNGELRLVVWDNINKEDASHTISLEGAKESERKKV